MLELGLAGFLATFLALGLRRPFLWVLCYLYVDIVSPQQISYFLLASLPVSLIVFVAAFGGWLVLDDKRDSRFTLRQALLVVLLCYCGYTTLVADFPAEAAEKWAWVWKALVFAIFLPLTLRTRLRIEATLLVMVLAASSIIITGGVKTILSGGGYGSLNLFVANNTGLFEGSIISTVAITIIPLIVWLMKYGTVYPLDWRVKAFGVALIFSCLLIPVGTQARTGLVCIGVMIVLSLRTVKRRFLYMTMLGLAGMIALPLLPQSYTERMSTIENHQADQSASTRIEVWKWTLGYVRDNPLGGGFNNYLANRIRINMVEADTSGNTTSIESQVVYDQGRAFHSSYFEMLGEQGWPGLFIWLWLQGLGIWQMERLRRRWKDRTGEDEQWQAPLANALQQAHIIYLVGGAFVGIAYQPFILMLIGVQCGLWTYLRRIDGDAARSRRPARTPPAPVAEPL